MRAQDLGEARPEALLGEALGAFAQRGRVPVSAGQLAHAGAGGFIHVGEEDFGISMVEALAAGTPVLAADAGGARDIVRPERDGVLISDPADPAQIRAGVRELARRDWDPSALRESAQRFSEERFRARLGEVLRAHGAR